MRISGRFISELMQRKNFFIVIGLIFLLVLGSGYLIFLRRDQKPAEFTTVERRDLKTVVSASGSIAGKSSIDLKFQSGGKLISLNVKSADTVQEGQILASLDNRDQAIALQQAQNTLRDKQAGVDKVLDDIHLFQYGNGGFANVASANETMTQRQLRTTAEVARDNAFDSVKSSQKALGDTIILSPVSGIIIQTNFVPGQTVALTDTIIKMIDNGQVFFDAEIDETDISRVSPGQTAEITLDAYPDKVFEGKVEEVQLFTKSTSSGATVVTVRIALTSQPDFINGLTGQAEILLSEAKNALTLPIEAVREDSTVFVQTADGIKPKQVEAGIKSDTEVEIKTGLNEGDKVLSNPPAKI